MSFLALKPSCVSLLAHISLAKPSNLLDLPPILRSFEDALHALRDDPAALIPPSLSSYTFFPFSQFLQVNPPQLLKSTPAHQAVFCDVLRVLAVLLRVVPFERAVLEQLWTFCSLTLGGPLSNTKQGLDTSWSEQVRRAVLQLLQAILQTEDAEELQIPGPIVSHTLNAVLLLAEGDEYETRLPAIETLKVVVERYLTPLDKLPQSLPGIVSTLCKVILASRGNSQNIVKCLDCLRVAINGALNDIRSKRLDLLDDGSAGATQAAATSLEALFANGTALSGIEQITEEPAASAMPRTLVNGNVNAQEPSTQPGHSKAWLRATASQVHRAFISLLPVLRNHDNAVVRAGFASFTSSLLSECRHSLSSESVRLLLEELLVLSCDSWEEVSRRAQKGLVQLADEKARADLEKIAAETLAALPHSIFTYGIANEAALQRQLYILTAAANRSTLSASHLKVEKWSRTLLRALEVTPISSTSSRKADATAPWLQANQSTLFLEDGQTSRKPASRLPPYPPLRLAHIAPGSSVDLLAQAIQAVAASLQDGASVLLEHFSNLAGYPQSGMPGSAGTASALCIIVQILVGIAASKESSSDKQQRIVRDMVELARAWLEREDDETPVSQGEETVTNGRSDALLDDEDEGLQAIQIVSGTTQIANLLGPEHRASAVAPETTTKIASYNLHIKALSLQLLGVSSSLAQSSFRPHLMHILYPLLQSLTPTMASNSGIVEAYAYLTLQHLASHSGYPSAAAMIVSNVDYVLNSVSARLRGSAGFGISSIDPLAPSVLVCVVDLAGEDVLPHLGDAVDEVFDALDKWHAYDLLVSELLRLLDKLVSVCRPEEEPEKEVNAQMHAVLDVQPQREKDLLAFEAWFGSRLDKRRDKMAEPISNGDLPECNPQQPFSELGSKETEDHQPDAEEEEEPDQDNKDPNDEGPAATRPQILVLAILRKCLYYIGHPSPFLRARVLSLITTCIPLLADRSADLLPEVQRFWPYILARLDDAPGSASPSYVLLECMRLISALMEHKGDFMNLRITSDVWPRVNTVLSAFQPPKGKADQFTVQHRLIRASIVTMKMAVANVPGIKNVDAWEMAMLFRRFLSAAWDTDLRLAVADLLTALSKVEADIVWLVLTAGRPGYEGIAYLGEERLDQTVVDRILATFVAQ